MKKTLMVLIVSGCSYFASAQTLDLGLRGGAASTWLINTNVFNAGSDQNPSSSISIEYGFHSEINFLGGTGIELDVIYSQFTQKYNGTFSTQGGLYQNITNLSDSTLPNNFYAKNESYTATTQLTMLKFPLLFHYQAKGGFIFEAGPEYAIINDATYTASYTGNPTGTQNSVSYSTKGSFASSSINGVLGFGWNIKLIPSGKLYLLASMRFEYGITDLKGTDALGEDMNNQSNNPVYLQHGFRQYGSYASTHMADGSLSIGLFYRLGLLPGGKSLL